MVPWYPKGYRVEFNGVRSCDHLRCRWGSWYARNVNPFIGRAPHIKVRTAYIYPGSCYREDP